MTNLSYDYIQSLASEKVFERGEEYFKSQKVMQLAFTGKRYTAKAMGSEEYFVRAWEEGENWEVICDCPYDWEDYCKHGIAVLLAILDRQKNNQDESINIDKHLKTHEEEENSIVNYRKIVRSTIPYDVEWDETYEALEGARHIEMLAAAFLQKGDIEEAVKAYQSIFEVLIQKIGKVDDSNGEFGSEIRIAFEEWNNSVSKLKDFDSRRSCYDYLFDKFGIEDWEDFSFTEELLETLINAITEVRDLEYVLEKLEIEFADLPSKDTMEVDFKKSFYLNAKLTLLEKLKRDTEYYQFAQQYLHETNILIRYINRLIQDDRHKEALSLAEENFKHDRGGYQIELAQILLSLYRKFKQNQKEKDILLYLFLNERKEDSFIYYDQLKLLCTNDNTWKDWFEIIVDKLRGSSTYKLIEVFLRENKIQELIEIARKSEEYFELERIAKGLSKTHKNDSFWMYKKLLSIYLSKSMNLNRRSYQISARWLRQMKKLDFDTEFKELISELRTKYIKRPAFLDEVKNL